MEKIVVNGGKKLEGECKIQGSKNASLPIIGATMLSSGENVLHMCPMLRDTETACKILQLLGCKTNWQEDALIINSSGLCNNEISKNLMNQMRSSIIFLGAILARCGEARVYFPGGCDIGSRPIDLHIDALKKMGVDVNECGGQLDCKVNGKRMHGAEIFLSFPSVGATENILLAAVTAKGKTVINNAAVEPEIEDLCNYLNKCGAKIVGGGTQIIQIEGVDSLKPCEYTIMPDRIVAATLLCGVAATGGEIFLKSVNAGNLSSVLPVLSDMGCKVRVFGKSIFLKAKELLFAPKQPIRTMPYPGFPTDLQPIMMALSCFAEGTTIFVETIFENRFRHVPELKRLGASIRIEGRVAVVEGSRELRGTCVYGTDLRGGAALIVAGLAAMGRTEIFKLCYVDRGYEKIEEQFSELGANIFRI